MAFTKTISDCNVYFQTNNHSKSIDWNAKNAGQKLGAFNQSKREIVVYLGRNLEDPSDDDVYRDDYGVFEQALYIIENTEHTASGDSPAVIDLAQNEEHEVLQRKGVLISPMAQRYFYLNRLKMVRG